MYNIQPKGQNGREVHGDRCFSIQIEFVALFLQVPFPAITIKSPDDLNQWGFPQRALDYLEFECAGEKNCTETEKLRKYYHFMIEKVIQITIKHLEMHAQKLQCTTPDQWRRIEYIDNPNTNLNKSKYFKLISGNKGKKITTNSAMIMVQNKTIGERLKTDLVKNIEANFATCYHFKVNNHFFVSFMF